MKQKAKLTALLLVGVGLTSLQAQEVMMDAVPASGGSAVGTNGSATYTVGQVFYTSLYGTNGDTITQGIQQPYEILTIVDEVKSIYLSCSVYPNPTVDILKLKVENYPLENLRFQVFDVMGKLILQDKVTQNDVTISMGNYSPSVYFLEVCDNKKVLKSFKVIKN